MGWINEAAPGHEGYIVGLVIENSDRPGDPPRVHELRYPDDQDRGRTAIQLFQVACACGWRSPQFRAPHHAWWTPFTAELDNEDLDDAAAELWHQHWHLPDPLALRAVVRVPRSAPVPLARAGSDASSGGSRLELADDAGGPRHFLQGRAVHAGDGLELLAGDGRWLAGRYEYHAVEDYLRPFFHFDVSYQAGPPHWAGPRTSTTLSAEARVELPPDAILRWPPR